MAPDQNSTPVFYLALELQIKLCNARLLHCVVQDCKRDLALLWQIYSWYIVHCHLSHCNFWYLFRGSFQELIPDILLNHDWLRGFRMASYGFLLYGPGSYAWYQFLDRCMPKQSFVNLSVKVCLPPPLWPHVLGHLSILLTKYSFLMTIVDFTILGHTEPDRAWSLCYCCSFCLEQLMVREIIRAAI